MDIGKATKLGRDQAMRVKLSIYNTLRPPNFQFKLWRCSSYGCANSEVIVYLRDPGFLEAQFEEDE